MIEDLLNCLFAYKVEIWYKGIYLNSDTAAQYEATTQGQWQHFIQMSLYLVQTMTYRDAEGLNESKTYEMKEKKKKNFEKEKKKKDLSCTMRLKKADSLPQMRRLSSSIQNKLAHTLSSHIRPKKAEKQVGWLGTDRNFFIPLC